MDIEKLRKGIRIGLGSITAVFVAGVGLASANGEVRAWNIRTGSNSANTTEVDVDEDIDFDIDNSATANNDIDVDVETGDNDANNNTGDGEVRGGDIRGTLEFETVLNGASQSFRLPSLGSFDVSSGNETTGFSSANDTTVNVDQTVDVDIDNDADVDNDISGTFDTGNNSANNNTGDGSARSGSASVNARLHTDLNANAGANLSLSGSGSSSMGDIEISNEETGANSSNNATVNLDRTVNVSQTNTANVDNDVDFTINTGGNTASANTGDGEVRSGDGNFDISVKNALN